MKRAIIGGFISIIGSVWALAVIISANSYAIDGWTTPPGKLFDSDNGTNLVVWFGASIATVVLGIILMAIEYFRKDN